MAGLFLVQWIHIIAGALWFGSVAASYFVMLPVLIQTPAAQSRVVLPLFLSKMAKMAPIAGQLTFWLGLIRGTVFGPIKSFADLIGTAYGHTFMTALILTIIAIVNGALTGRRVERRVWDGDQYR